MAGKESRLRRMAARLPRKPVWQFALSVLLVAVLVGAGTDQAIKQARVVTATIARTAIEPALRDSIVSDDPKALAVLDRAVRRYVVRGDVVRVVYSDEPRLIGSVYPLAEDDLETIETGKSSADISDLKKLENRYERGF